jgi:hypothetical protein
VPDWTAAGPGAVDVGRLTGQSPEAKVPAARKGTPAGGRTAAARGGMADLHGMLDERAARSGALTRVG